MGKQKHEIYIGELTIAVEHGDREGAVVVMKDGRLEMDCDYLSPGELEHVLGLARKFLEWKKTTELRRR